MHEQMLAFLYFWQWVFQRFGYGSPLGCVILDILDSFNMFYSLKCCNFLVHLQSFIARCCNNLSKCNHILFKCKHIMQMKCKIDLAMKMALLLNDTLIFFNWAIIQGNLAIFMILVSIGVAFDQ